MTKNSQELKPVIKRKPLTKRAVANLRNSVATRYANVMLDQNFLFSLFNPDLEEKEEMSVIIPSAVKKEDKENRIIFKDPTYQIPEHYHKRLPNITEFKMFLWMLKQAQENKTNILVFDTRHQCLTHLGYSPSPQDFELLSNTYQSFFGYTISFHHSFIFPKTITHVSKCVTIITGSAWVVDKKTNEITEVRIEFGKDFWELCNTENSSIRRLNLKVIDKIYSPLTLKLYLFLIKWTGKRALQSKDQHTGIKEYNHTYKRLYQYDLIEFLTNLGFSKKEYTKTELRQLKFRIKKALTQIADVDPDYRFTLDEELFASRKKLRFNEVL